MGIAQWRTSSTYWTQCTKDAGLQLRGTFQQLARECTNSLFQVDEIATSRAWNDKVNIEDARFEYVDDPKDDNAVIHGLRTFAGLYWRMLVRQQDEKTKHLMTLGGADRMSMSWFLQWLKDRKNLPLRELLKDIFSGLIFSQHMRIALARFDGTTQRLRFLVRVFGLSSKDCLKIYGLLLNREKR